MGIINGFTFTFVKGTDPELRPEHSITLEEYDVKINFCVIEEKYGYIYRTLRYLAPEMMDVFFPNSNDICMHSDWVTGLIPLTDARLNRLKDIYNLLNYNWLNSERFRSLDRGVKTEFLREVFNLRTNFGEFQKFCNFKAIPYLLETVYSDAGENDFYLLSYKYWPSNC